MKCAFCQTREGKLNFTIQIKRKTKTGLACLGCAKELAQKVGIDPVDIYEADPFGYDI